jgi:hypothetical protein
MGYYRSLLHHQKTKATGGGGGSGNDMASATLDDAFGGRTFNSLKDPLPNGSGVTCELVVNQLVTAAWIVYVRMWIDDATNPLFTINIPPGTPSGTTFVIDGGNPFVYCQNITFEAGTGDIGDSVTVRIVSGGLARVPAGNLLAEFRPYMQSSGQVVADFSGNGRHGSLGSNAGSADTNDPSWVTSGLDLGIDDYAVLPLSAMNAITFTWILSAKMPDTLDYANIIRATYSSGYIGYDFSAIADDRSLVIVNSTGSTESYIGSGNPWTPDNTEQCIFVTYDRAAADLHIGKIVAGAITERSSNLSITTLPTTTLSQFRMGNGYSDGIIRLLTTYGAVISDANILSAAASHKAHLNAVGITLP